MNKGDKKKIKIKTLLDLRLRERHSKLLLPTRRMLAWLDIDGRLRQQVKATV